MFNFINVSKLSGIDCICYIYNITFNNLIVWGIFLMAPFRKETIKNIRSCRNNFQPVSNLSSISERNLQKNSLDVHKHWTTVQKRLFLTKKREFLQSLQAYENTLNAPRTISLTTQQTSSKPEQNHQTVFFPSIITPNN